MAPEPVPALATARLLLSPLRAADADGMLRVYADERMYEFTGWEPPTLDALRERYERLAIGWSPDRTEQWCNWIVRFTGDTDPVGAVQASVAADRAWASVAWEIGLPWQRRGIASEAALVVVEWLLAEGIERITASIHPDHVASARVAERIGLVRTDELDDGEIVWALPPRS